jgi:hypothetical protein
MKMMWEYPWTDWVGAFLAQWTLLTMTEERKRVVAMTLQIIQRLVTFDLQRRSSAIARLKGALSDCDTFQAQMIETVLDYFSITPCLSFNNGSDVLKNLVHLYRFMQDYFPPSSPLFCRFMLCINHLACHNNIEVRASMKATGLFDIRDEILLNLLQADLPDAQYDSLIRQFSFELVADQPKFRETNGLLCLLRMFFKTAHTRLQMTLGCILIGVFGAYEENRRVINKIIDDTEVSQWLFEYNSVTLLNINTEPRTVETNEGQVKAMNTDRSNDTFSLFNSTTSLLNGSDRLLTRNLVERTRRFLINFHQVSPDRVLRRTNINQRIETLFLTTHAATQRMIERQTIRCNKRNRAHKDRVLRETERLNRGLMEFQKRNEARMMRMAGACQDIQDGVRRRRYERRRVGEEMWRDFRTVCVGASDNHH